ncbi:hypothetical protein L9F63_011243, partial [Diploptera punctata]
MFKILITVSVIAAGCLGHSEAKPNFDARIVGGDVADIEDFPYEVSIEYSGVFDCAGSIISNEWVVTAAHYLKNLETSKVQVRSGTAEKENGGILHGVSEIIMNPNFDEGHNYDGDIALIKVVPPFEFGPTVQSIPLAEKVPEDGAMATVSGWGAELDGDVLSPELRYVNVPIVNHDLCEHDYFDRGGITNNMICAGFEQGGKDACTGDVGGALVVEGKLVGIVSFGYHCGDPDYPGVYTNVAVFRQFIHDTTEVRG